MLQFASAYKQLNGYEREFVDGFLRSVEIEAEKRFERITTTLERISQTIDFATLDARARDLLSKPLIGAAIRERVEAMAAARDLTPERVVKEHAVIAMFSLKRFFPEVGEDGNPKFDARNASEMDWAALQAIEVEETYGRNGTTRKIKIKAHPKQTSLDALSKFMGLDKADNVEYAAYKTLPAELAQLPNSASVADLAETYARLIDG